ncbi:hypothetical protein RB595_002053 [Gaeumannomyces hyphopodioides]
MASEPVYFELSWSILSTIGAANVFFGLMVVSVTGFSPIAAVPIVTSAACAVANGLCYYAFYLTSPPPGNQAVASAFADALWGVQEAGLSFYSYVILSRILRDRRRRVFVGAFWTIMLAIVVIRTIIGITRVRYIIGGDRGLQNTVNHLHMAYFPLIALLECVSAFYLLTAFARARVDSLKRATKTDLFRYLTRSTELRLALLAVVGTMRAVSYSFQASAQSATNLASQFDRFAYTLECLFPVVMFIDMLSSKVVSTNPSNYDASRGSRQARSSRKRQAPDGKDDMKLQAGGRVERVVEVRGGAGPAFGKTSSQERIIHNGSPFGTAASDIALGAMDPKRVGISKTVEFEVEVSHRSSPA